MNKNNLTLMFFSFLVLVVTMYFVVAVFYDKAPSTAAAGSTISMATFNVSNISSVDNENTTNSHRLFNNITIALIGTATIGNITNVTVSDGTNIYYDDSFTSSPIVVIISANVTSDTNFTVNFTLNSSATFDVTLGANITAINVGANLTTDLTALFDSSLTNVTESTAPTATAKCSPKAVSVGSTFPCTCSGSDSGATASGVDTSIGSSTSPDKTGTPVNSGAFTFTCTVTDKAGNIGTATDTYTVDSGGGGGGGVITTQVLQKVNSFSKITPGVVSIVKNFDPEIGLKEIKIEVNSEAQSVKITVTKYDSKPAQVTKEKSGKVNQYLEIDTVNLNDKLSKATITAKVEKSWISQNGLDKEDIAVSKFDESSEEWNELTTDFMSEDDIYYYYDFIVTSFSFFVIGEKTSVTKEAEEGRILPTPSEIIEKGKSLIWLWVLIIIIVLVIITYSTKKTTKKVIEKTTDKPAKKTIKKTADKTTEKTKK